MADFLVTTTSYQQESVRLKCAERTAIEAERLHYPLVLIDGSAKKFALRTQYMYPEVTNGMGASRRYAFFIARELSLKRLREENFFLWLEPEKYDLLRFVPEILAPLKSGAADIVIPKRSETSWVTYPEFQYESEARLNTAYEEATGLIGFDGAFGPVACNERAIEHFIDMIPQDYDTSLDDDYIQLFAPIVAQHEGCTIASVSVDFNYPPEQRVEEEAPGNQTMRQKRLQQLEKNTRGFLRIAEVLRNIA